MPHSRVEYDLAAGKYDLRIFNTSYDRDNGKFECRIKQRGSGKFLFSKSVQLTVLLKPSQPVITPSSPTGVEGTPLNLTCSSVGGSPPPQIYWYSEGNSQLLDAQLIRGENRDEPTVSILTMTPTKEDDGSSYRCTAWNRALGQSQEKEASTILSVNCKLKLVLQK